MSRVLFAPRDLPPLGPDVAADLPRYRTWQAQREAGRAEVARTAGIAPAGPGEGSPSVAWLLVVDRLDPGWLRRSLRSLAEQTDRGWELSVAVVGSLSTEDEQRLVGELAQLPAGQTSTTRCPSGTGRGEATAAALAATSAGAVALLDQGDQLAPDAVALLRGGLAEADIAYGDEDRIGPPGDLAEPALKPDWSPELLLSIPYLGRPLAIRRALVEAAGGIGDLPDGDWEHDLMLRTTERARQVAHVAEVLCHRTSEASGSGSSAPPAAGGAVTAALRRRGEQADIGPGPVSGAWRVRRQPTGRPSVSAIIPFRDGPAFLRTCVDSVTATAGEADLELVLVDNGSVEPETQTLVDQLAERPDVVVVHDDRPFNWAALNNGAAEIARGQVLLFLNNDIEASQAGWLEALVAQALRPEVGAVGARLLYPGGRIQHAGLVVGLGGAAGHILVGLPAHKPGYLGMAVLARDCSAVTGACLATRRAVFDDLGGFDVSLGVDLNDIDFCLRARQRGLRVLYEPQAELVHYESPSRGTSGSLEDIDRFVGRWAGLISAGDPFLNRNLSRLNSSCALREPDEEGWWQEWRSTLGRS